MEHLMDQFIHIVDSHNGIYSAQAFAKRIDFETAVGISQEDWNILLAGPDHINYVEVWADELSKVKVFIEGKPYLVWENEGIYLYPEEIQDQINWDELA